MPLSPRGSRHRRDPRFRSRPGHRCLFRPGFVFLHRGELQRCPSGHFFFVQGASIGDPVTEVDQFFLYKRRALARTLRPFFCARSERWRPGYRKVDQVFFVKGASFSDAPSKCSARQAILDSQKSPKSQLSHNCHYLSDFCQSRSLFICEQTLKTCLKAYFWVEKFGGGEKRL